MLMVLQYLTARPVVSIVTMNASQPQRRCSWDWKSQKNIPQYTCLTMCTSTFHSYVNYAYLCWIFMLIPHPSNCVQQQPLLKNRVLRYFLIDHQRIEQQHQRSQAKDSFAKTCQTQFDMQHDPGAVSSDCEYHSNLWGVFVLHLSSPQFKSLFSWKIQIVKKSCRMKSFSSESLHKTYFSRKETSQGALGGVYQYPWQSPIVLRPVCSNILGFSISWYPCCFAASMTKRLV